MKLNAKLQLNTRLFTEHLRGAKNAFRILFFGLILASLLYSANFYLNLRDVQRLEAELQILKEAGIRKNLFNLVFEKMKTRKALFNESPLKEFTNPFQ